MWSFGVIMEYMPTTIKYLIIHHAGGTDLAPLADSSNYTLTQCNNDHKARFNMLSSLGHYCGYTYFIDKAGVVTQTRKDGEEGAHTIGHNFDSIGVCLAGNFDAFLPTAAQIISLKELMKRKVAEFNIPLENIVPHRHFAKKSCYGNKLADDWARNLIRPSNNTAVKTEIKKKLGEISAMVDTLQS